MTNELLTFDCDGNMLLENITNCYCSSSSTMPHPKKP